MAAIFNRIPPYQHTASIVLHRLQYRCRRLLDAGDQSLGEQFLARPRIYADLCRVRRYCHPVRALRAIAVLMPPGWTQVGFHAGRSFDDSIMM
jgi:hypothetical protein